MNKLTFIIACGPYHTNIVHEAVASVRAQTIPCDLIVIEDTEGKGAGYARNRGIEQAQGELISFLDADDTIAPNFAEQCLAALTHYAQSHDDPRYVYTDWIGVDNTPHQPPHPSRAWVWGEQGVHLVTTVLPTERVRLIGGFDETMTGLEDVDFYIRLRLSGVCGLHVVNEPLVHYREGGQRSVTARQSGAELAAFEYMKNRYGAYDIMGCCGDNTPGPTGPTNEPLEGDILAQAVWHGNRQERGRATGRLYPRTAFPKMLYVAEADVSAAPMHWKRVSSPMQAANGVILQPQYTPNRPWQETANALFGGGQAQAAPTPIEYKRHDTGMKKAAVVEKAKEWTKVEGSLE